MPDEKRIKDFEPATELLNDDWFAVDSPSQGTRKMQSSMFQAGLQSQITANRDDIDLQAGQISTLQLGVGHIGDKVDILDSAVTTDAYSASNTYAVGDYCIYEDVMYKCTTAISTPEAFNPSHWSATSIENEINQLNSKIATLTTNKTSGESINVTSYLEGNPYTFPNDGYVTLRSNSATSGYIRCVIRFSNGTTQNDVFEYMNVNASHERHSLFVKKGMKFYVYANTASGGTVTYTPLVV